MGMNKKIAAGALALAGMFATGGNVVAQDSQSTNRDTTNQTTTQDKNKTTSPNANQTTQDTTQSTTQSTTPSTTQDTNRDANMPTGQQVTNRAEASMSGAGMLSSSDRKFAMDAAMGGMTEVEMGRLASQKGSSDAVKQFGERLVQDHTKANEELTTLAGTKGITLPKELDAKHQAMVAKMTALSGAEFDRAFIKEMQSDHKKDISMFQKQADKGKDADLKAFAAKTLPTLREHAQMIGQMGTGTGGMKNMSGRDNRSGTTNPSNTGTSNPTTTSPSNTGTSNPSGSGTTRPNP